MPIPGLKIKNFNLHALPDDKRGLFVHRRCLYLDGKSDLIQIGEKSHRESAAYINDTDLRSLLALVSDPNPSAGGEVLRFLWPKGSVKNQVSYLER